MNYWRLLNITSQSAWSTLVTLNRQLRALWNWYNLTFLSPIAVARYEEIGRILGIFCCLAIAFGQLVRAYLQPLVAERPRRTSVPRDKALVVAEQPGPLAPAYSAG